MSLSVFMWKLLHEKADKIMLRENDKCIMKECNSMLAILTGLIFMDGSGSSQSAPVVVHGPWFRYSLALSFSLGIIIPLIIVNI